MLVVESFLEPVDLFREVRRVVVDSDSTRRNIAGERHDGSEIHVAFSTAEVNNIKDLEFRVYPLDLLLEPGVFQEFLVESRGVCTVVKGLRV